MNFDNLPKMDPYSAIYAQIKTQYSFLRQERVQRGLTLWEFNYVTAELQPANIVKTKTQANFDTSVDKRLENLVVPNTVGKLNQKKDCIYLWALNEKNAYKKVLKILKLYQKLTLKQNEKQN